jgi:hypothetical protein
VIAADLAVTALAERAAVAFDGPDGPEAGDDTVLRLLRAWAADIDRRPIMVDIEAPEPAAMRRRPWAAARSVAAMTMALTLSSTGIAAAVQGNPLGPIRFVVDQLGQLHRDRSTSVDLFGSRSTPLGDRRGHDGQARAERDERPSRGQREERPTDTTRPEPPSSVPIVSHRAHEPARSSEARRHQERRRALPVRRPPTQSPVAQKPDSDETPPSRPEQPALPSGSATWPKPAPDDRPAPPDRPASSPMPPTPTTTPVR